MHKRVIVLGANGMAGHVIATCLKEDGCEVISVARSKSFINPTVLMDVTDFASLAKFLNKSKADVIVNCVGLLNKTAEDNPDQAILINSFLPHFLESQTKNTKTKIIHISTDCVFSGEEGGYTENALKNGSGFYAQTKALGELDNSKDLTFRTSIIGPEININGIGLFHWFASQNGTIKGYTEVYWTGITTIELANAIKAAISENLSGVYHLVNDSIISKFRLISIFNHVFDKNLNIEPFEGYISDKSLINSRTDFAFRVKSYEEMITELKSWIQINRDIYPHYAHLLSRENQS
jgi:dTDP-4-dehydrorhamnose reductase